MEVYLNGKDYQLQFPVLPSSYNVDGKAQMSSLDITTRGETDVFEGKGLKKYKFSSEFPNGDRGYCKCSPKPPEEYIKQIEKWMDTGEVVRFIVTEKDINLEVRIESFSHEVKDCTKDEYFDIALIEHQPFLYTFKPKESKPSSGNKDTNKTNRPNNTSKDNKKTRYHTVGKGDSLWSLSKKYYGDGSQYKKILNANKDKIKNPDVISDGWKLVIP